MRPLALAAALLLPAASFAQGTVFQYLDYKVIATQQQPFQYYIDGRNPSPAGISLTLARQATENAWNTWNAVSCASPKAQSQGLTGTTVPNPGDRYDAFSVTPVFATNSNSPDYTNQIANNFITAITIPLTYSGVLITCDTYLNMVDYQWSTVTPTPGLSFDLETVMLHETGHCLGLYHYGSGAIMDSTVNTGENQRTLHNDDVLALCNRYPASGATGAPCLADGGCGGAALKCVTQPMTTGPSRTFCTQGCTTGSGAGNCPLPLSCESSTDFSPTFNGACLLPGGNVTQVGKPCTANTQCSSSLGLCLLPENAPSGGQFWVQGYCSQTCDPGQPPCPAGSSCILVDGQFNLCLQNCRPGLADCRGDYACAQVTGGGVCIPRCYTNADCSDQVNYECRTCDGLCVAKQNLSGQVGDLCVQDSTCGVGQICLSMTSKSAGLQCTRQCGSGCGTCPTGSSCHALERGDLFCMRDCSGPGSCGPGLRCGDTTSGKACLPGCTVDAECPVGQSCQGGECYTPVNPDDAGCTILCDPPDAGRPITVRPDAGTGGGPGSAGCGCQGEGTGAASAAFALLGWAVLLLLRRRA